ncbi:MAG: right-handed parallel beta-helix repeat-containing protein [Candidatus Lokiarchaeota archaeon]|nr:right-handed parallel beta-helix repeat-containing protein [Candidatus Lokiarchaeota archaeon]
MNKKKFFKKSKSIKSFMGLSIILVLFSINNFYIKQTNENKDIIIDDTTNLKNSGYWNLPYIHINNDNWSNAVSQGWCSGDGSVDTPYTIENVTINVISSPTGNGIFINNSTNYFIIKNCTVSNSYSGNWNAGIQLNNTCNGQLINNDFSLNTGHGIILRNKCNDIVISNNSIINNDRHGILLDNECNNNIIFNNTIDDDDKLNRGILLRYDCSDNIISENDVSTHEIGIFLTVNCMNNIITDNDVTNNYKGMVISDHCSNNSILENNVNDNDVYGIQMDTYSYNNTISKNNVNNHDWYGIYIYEYSYNNTISENYVSYGWHDGIFLEHCYNSTISKNNVTNNPGFGIELTHAEDNKILENYIRNTGDDGLYLHHNANNNTISDNTLIGNDGGGIYVYWNSDNNTISDNTLIGNSGEAIYVYTNCNENRILDNHVSYSAFGIYLLDYCHNSTISRNTVSHSGSTGFGIRLTRCYNSTISKNNVSYNPNNGISLNGGQDDKISGNLITNNGNRGIQLYGTSQNNDVFANFIYGNGYGIYANPTTSNNTIYYNYISGSIIINAFNEGINNWNNSVVGNYWDDYYGIDSNSDGIGETPYNITGTESNKDYKPLVNFFFSEIPSDITYEIGTTGHTIGWTVINITNITQTYDFNISRNDNLFDSFTGDLGFYVSYSIDDLLEGIHIYIVTSNILDEINPITTTTITVTNMIPEFTSVPNDILYKVGDTGNNISWIFTDISINNPTYTISRNGSQIVSDTPCYPGVSVEISVDGLSAGVYEYIIEINDGYGKSNTDMVLIIVTSSAKGDIAGYNLWIIVGLSSLILLFIIKKTKFQKRTVKSKGF